MTSTDFLVNKIDVELNHLKGYFSTTSLSEGTLGLSLYYYYRYLYSKDEYYLEEVSVYLEKSISDLNNQDILNFSILDLIELGKYLCFLHSENVLETNSLVLHFNGTKDIINKYIEESLLNKDLDSNTGLIAVGHYLLDFYTKIEQRYIEKIISFILDSIVSLSYEKEEFIFWRFTMRNPKDPIIELNSFHGIAGVLYFFARCKYLGIYPDKYLRYINSTFQFLITQCNYNARIFFPSDSENRYERPLFNNLAYGDLGIGHTIFSLGIIMSNNYVMKKGLLILKNVAKLRNYKKYIVDAELVYGASGLMAYFDSINKLYPTKYFERSSDYWYNKLLTFYNQDNKWAGFETYMNGDRDNIQLSFSHGIIGISIALMCRKLSIESKFLSFYNYHFI